jgi:putative ABC transport system permease protein
MRSAPLAWRSLTRQPARTILGVAGVAIVGALLFDMLLLSRGLVISFQDLLDGVGYDIRVTATGSFPGNGPLIPDAAEAVAELQALDAIDEVVALRFGKAYVSTHPDESPGYVNFMGASAPARSNWRIVAGDDLSAPVADGRFPLVVGRKLAERYDLVPGRTLRVRGACASRASVLPEVEFVLSGVADFHFDSASDVSTVTTIAGWEAACSASPAGDADLLLAVSNPEAGTTLAVDEIKHARDDLYPFSNAELVASMSGRDFSYFRQIAFALSAITLFFTFLLVTTLLTVSVNQRLAEVAALRALGFARRRVVSDLIWESMLLVGAGWLLSLPLGGLLAWWLDSILRSMPDLPMGLHFFVFQSRAVAIQCGMLFGAGLAAAVYPVYLAARLPIAATLRREVVS